MEKLEKNINDKINNKKIKKLKKRRSLNLIKKNFFNRPYFLDFKKFFNITCALTNLEKYIYIKFKANNFFFTLYDKNNNKILYHKSSGTENIKITKKSTKYVVKSFVPNLLKKLALKLKKTYTIGFFITAPTKTRKKILVSISKVFQSKNLIIKFLEKKAFNGCRPAKKIRKKRTRSLSK